MGLRREEQFGQENDGEEGEFLLLDPMSDYLVEPGAYDRDEILVGGAEAELAASPLIAMGKTAVLVAAAGWTGFAVWLLARRDFQMPGLEQIPSAAASFSAPLILLGLIYLLLSRSSIGEASRFGKITSLLRKEAEALDLRLAVVNQQLDTARRTLAEQTALLEEYGGSASVNLEASARTLTEHASTSAKQAEIIERAGLALARQFGQLIDVMPSVEERAARISSTLTDGSETLTEKVDRLENRLEAMVKLLDEARARTTGATQSLTAQLMHLQDATRSASEEVTGMADLSTNRIDAAIGQARRAIEEAGMTLDLRTAELNVLVEQSRSALDEIGGGAVSAYGESITAIETRLHNLDEQVLSRSAAISALGDDLAQRIETLGDQFSQLELQGVSGSERLSDAIEDLARRTMLLDDALQSGNRTAEAMIARAESLLVALDASVRELDEGHPAALTRLEEKIDTSQRLLGVIMPEIEHLEAISAAVLGNARESEELLSGQSRRIAEWIENGEASLASYRDQVADLQRSLEAADGDAKRLSDSAGPQLVATLLRVKEAADQAGERARAALSRAITDATDELSEASEKALTERLGEKFRARIDGIGSAADQAVKAAHAASDRLMRQLITIADTTASIEQRIAEADKAAEKRDSDNFSHQSAMLIESLNSLAIDVAKILSTDVGDASWAAYLKGDRGVFSRQAVRLLGSAEARSIVQLYSEDETFAEAVNRYIHDFEAMLRNILASREGTSLAVTLLSSDIGKLYVALAQAIDRLKDS